MGISEGLIWTYYDCSNRCFLFGELEINCLWMNLSYALFALGIIGVILFLMYKFAKK